ncbi:MAG: LPS export ABC transporter ATP-binding protein [Nitrospirae bacterium]|nr:LPS export ABC transporter ATP-binding protein [Nitrospirota bacterium]
MSGNGGTHQGRPVLTARNLVKSYRDRRVVNDVSLDLRGGEVVGLLGPNGAGKTTVFSIVVGLTRPDTGAVLLNGEEVTALPMYRRARRGIGYLPQEPSIFRKLTVEENLRAILEIQDLEETEQEERLTHLLRELDIRALASQKGYALSGGERRRVEIARALVTNPSFLLLDEPFSGIDPITVLEIQRILSRLRAEGIGILITDHNVRDTLKITDRAYLISGGVIIEAGPPAAIAGSAKARQIYLGEEFTL